MHPKAEINTERLNKIIMPLDTLSKRKYEIAVLLSKQLTSKQIAAKLCICHNTANCHRQHIFSNSTSLMHDVFALYAKKEILLQTLPNN